MCEDWKQSILQPALQRNDANNVFNADETGLLWRLLPEKTLTAAGEAFTGEKRAEKITLLVCVNMDGTEKHPLLTVGKFKSPRCFRNVQHLPTEYDTNIFQQSMIPTSSNSV